MTEPSRTLTLATLNRLNACDTHSDQARCEYSRVHDQAEIKYNRERAKAWARAYISNPNPVM